jgi:hypothetical protein
LSAYKPRYFAVAGSYSTACFGFRLFLLSPFAPHRLMIYRDIPMIIVLLATGYLMTVYLLLMLAERSSKVSR